MATTKVSKGLIKDGAVTIEKLNNALVVTEAEGIVNNNNDITVPTSAAVKDYVDSSVVGGLIYQGSYDASTNTPVLDSRGTQIAVTQGWTYTVTVDGTFYGEVVKVGDVLIAETNLSAGTGALTDWTTVQSNIDLATAGTSGTAIRGLAGFDEDNFIVADGFVNLKVGDVIPSNIVQSIVAGNGITVDNTDPENPVITNSSPDQIVTITGLGSTTVTGLYPNFSISSSGTEYTAGAGLALNGTEFSNTAPDQTVVLNEGANITITGTYPNFTITGADSPTAPVVSVNTQTGAVVLDTDDIAEGTTNLYDKTVGITGSGSTTITGTYPNFNVDSINTEYVAGSGIEITGTTIANTAPDQTVVITGTGAATITGTYPNFNVNATDTNTTYAAGTDISIVGTTINNTAPDQLVTLTEGDNVTITGTYPNFTIAAADAPAQLVTSVNTQVGAVVLDTDDIAEGAANLYDKTVVITGTGAATVTGTYPSFNINATDTNTTYTAGSGLELTGTVFSNTAPDQTVVITGSGGATVTGTYPNFNIETTDAEGVETVVAGASISVDSTDPANPIVTNTAPDQTVAITGGGSTSISGTYPNFTVTSTDTVYTAGSGLALNGTEFSNTAPDQTVTITGAGDTVVTGTYPNFTVTSTSEPIPTVLPSDFVFINVKNETGSTIPLGTGLMAVGTDGNSGHILVAPMVADGSVEPRYYIGVLEEELLNGGLGRAVTQGEVNQINTNAFLDSDILWCDPANPGGFTKIEPSAPNLKISTAIVLNASTNGKIFVRVQGNEGLHELHDVGISSQTDKQVLAWNDTAGYWQNQDNLYSLTAGTGLDGGTITTTGTISLANTAVTPGAYTNANITVDQQGRITLASNGDPGGVTSFTASNGTFITLTPNTSQTGAATLTADLSASGTADSTTFLRGDNQWAALPTPRDTTRYIDTATIESDDINIFIISTIPESKNYVDLYINGVYQSKTTYSVSDNVVTLDSGFFPNGALVETVTTGTDPNIPLPVLSLTSDINTITADNNIITADETFVLN